MTDVRQWLDSLGLSEYADAFDDNAIGWNLLPKLDHELLKEVGISVIGHRLQILEAAAALDTEREQSSQPRSSQPPKTAGAERRQLTVMFCDLVGSSALSERLDPEDYRELLAAYQSAASKAIQRLDGYIARYMGDGLLVYFGYPQAHEDDPERAVRAGLDIVDTVSALHPMGGERLQVRIGIATGLVLAGDIVGEGTSEEHAVLGETPNLAARLQAMAEPDAVLVSETTRRLVEGRFELESLGGRAVKGFSGAITAHRVHAIRRGSRFEISTIRGLSPLVGRKEELGLLLARWRHACSGEGQVVVLSGEPGIGKSRLAQALVDHVSSEAPEIVRYQCSPYHTSSAYHPVIEELERAAQFARYDTPAEKLAKIEALYSAWGEGAEGDIALLVALLSLPTDRYSSLDLTPQKQKTETISVLVRRHETTARTHPVLAVFEDVHWIDPTTMELLGVLIGATTSLPALIVITARPEFTSPWTGYGHVTHHSLNRLSRGNVATLVDAINGAEQLPAFLRDQIVEKTDGVALFVEELTKSVLESIADSGESAGDQGRPDQSPALSVPNTLRDSLMARLDRMAEAKEIAQAGAVLGREFPHDTLAAIASFEEPALNSGLVKLIDAGLLTRRGSTPDPTYTFKHALVQDAAYNSLLISKRRRLHEQAVEYLSGGRHGIDVASEVLAHHYSNADAPFRAAGLWREAGEQAIARSANLEALAHIERGLRELERLPHTNERDELELRLQVLLGNTVSAAHGYADPKVGTAYSAARMLCQMLHDDEELALILRGQHVHELNVGRVESARETAEELARLVRAADLRGFRTGVQHNLSQAYFLLGDPATALEHGERGVQLGDVAQHPRWTGGDPRVQCHVWAAASASLLGDYKGSKAHAERALSMSEENPQLFSRVHGIALLCIPAIVRCDTTAAAKLSTQAVEICSEFEIPYWLKWAQLVSGWARVESENPSAGLAEVRDAYQAFSELGSNFCLSFFSSLLAERLAGAGELEEGLAAAGRALDIAEATGERWWQAETYRIYGKLLDASSRTEEAAQHYAEGLALAKQQGSHTLMVRSAMELCLLRKNHGRGVDARELLTQILTSFDESIVIPEIEDAKLLLEKLSD